MQTIDKPREEVSQYAPKMITLTIPSDKIRDVIGTGGKMINQIIDECDQVKVDIEDDGRCVIYHSDKNMLNKAKEMIENIIRDAKVGEIYEGKVTRIEKFGAFVELFPGTDGLLHVSKIAYDRVEKPEDVLKLGEIVKVIVTEIDDKGRVNVSRRDLLEKPEGWDEAQKAKKEAYAHKGHSEGGERRVFKKRD